MRNAFPTHPQPTSLHKTIHADPAIWKKNEYHSGAKGYYSCAELFCGFSM